MQLGNVAFIGRKPLDYYKGLLIKADLGLHAQITAILKHELMPGASIMDLGAGEGALSRRLMDQGFRVTAADVDPESFRCAEVPFTKVDFDDPSELAKFVQLHSNAYDAVIGIEVIEHVQDQWSYVRQLMAMAKPGGMVLISTPNTTSWLSRITFLRSGQFHQFSDSDLGYGHISPVTRWELGLILRSAGAEHVSFRPGGTLPLLYLTGLNRGSLLSLMALPVRLFMRGPTDGWCVIATGRKPR